MDVYPLVVALEIMALHGYVTDSLKLKCPVESWNHRCENSREPEGKSILVNFSYCTSISWSSYYQLRKLVTNQAAAHISLGEVGSRLCFRAKFPFLKWKACDDVALDEEAGHLSHRPGDTDSCSMT